ncbi:amidohydrolase family protein [Marinomonas transparens]|uniref:Amidohydrolase family protein n=1 Tax=Marinomonas transparens TaxID=2795388 RepID=A0A934JY38_9GAMM|nr:amidohydrolase family protein [Marinomonas transparens]MBJ7539375.1 amidohydrolase family protein [Marinomonas transparens]
MMRIDAHQHFWHLKRNDYGWLTPELTTLYRDFTPDDLTPLLQQHNIDGTVLVQAAPTDAETDFLLALSEQHACIKGVVGWVDFDSQQATERIVQLAQHPKLVGLRPMIQDIEDVDWMLSSAVGKALQVLSQHRLVFDALVKPQHLANLKALVDQHPQLKVVIDHAAKPNIKDRDLAQWQRDMAVFRDHPQVSCKLSGLVTEAKKDWQAEELYPYIDTLFEVFGEQRLLWGSDWPVCLLASSYEKWFDTVNRYLTKNPCSKDKILGGNAIRVYGL